MEISIKNTKKYQKNRKIPGLLEAKQKRKYSEKTEKVGIPKLEKNTDGILNKETDGANYGL